MRASGGPSILRELSDEHVALDMEDAARMNVHAVAVQVFVGGEITQAWDMIEAAVREGILERALTPAAAQTPVVPEQLGGYPRLRGATALVAAPHFAAPRVA